MTVAAHSQCLFEAYFADFNEICHLFLKIEAFLTSAQFQPKMRLFSADPSIYTKNEASKLDFIVKQALLRLKTTEKSRFSEFSGIFYFFDIF